MPFKVVLTNDVDAADLELSIFFLADFRKGPYGADS
jgi:hypothetical protein